jgi:hypothetical protein
MHKTTLGSNQYTQPSSYSAAQNPSRESGISNTTSHRRNALNPQTTATALDALQRSNSERSSSSCTDLVVYKGPERPKNPAERALELSKKRNLTESDIAELAGLVSKLSLENQAFKRIFEQYMRSSQLPLSSTYRPQVQRDELEDRMLANRRNTRLLLENGESKPAGSKKTAAFPPPNPRVEELGSQDSISLDTQQTELPEQKRPRKFSGAIEPHQLNPPHFPDWTH